jgi:crotonobetainyl-CoA:carnitine CoA-transferase CaiB-like acyl-CoA transferase
MGAPELATDVRYATHGARGANAAALDARIEEWTRTRSADDLLALLAEHAVPSGRVYTAADALADPHYAARGMVQRLTSTGGTTMPVPGVVPRFSRTPGSIRSAGPALGADTDALVGDAVQVES